MKELPPQWISKLLRGEGLSPGILIDPAQTEIKFVLDAWFPPHNTVEQEFDDATPGFYDFDTVANNYDGTSDLIDDDGQTEIEGVG